MDKVTVTTLREKTGLESVKDRMNELTQRYIEKALANANPLIEQLVDDYLDFRNRNLIDPKAAGNDMLLKHQIEMENERRLTCGEAHATTLCSISDIR